MRLLAYIAAAALFLAFFAFVSRYYGDDQLYQYAGYAFLACAFLTLLVGFRDYIDEGRLVKFNKKETKRKKREDYQKELRKRVSRR